MEDSFFLRARVYNKNKTKSVYKKNQEYISSLIKK